MSKTLEKALKDAKKEKKSIIGSKQVLNSLKNSKLIVLSQSAPKKMAEKIIEGAKKEKISTVQFEGSSVALGRLCGLQFRVSTISLTSVSDANIKSIMKESKTD
ncbi:MAG: ribosomal L7Ae/L30e/S12e/Gadd45 family protein [Nitrosopumilaceae archaeon]